MHGKVLSLSCHAIVIFEQLFSSKAYFPANVFQEVKGITDALKKNAHDQNGQTLQGIELRSENSFLQVILAGTFTGVQGDIRCKVFGGPFHSKIT